MQILNPVSVAHKLIQEQVYRAEILVDVTAGKGNDTLYLAENSLATAKIYAFDIQELALRCTKEKLQEKGLERKVTLILDNHANVKQYILRGVDVAIFNLGYLPGGNHELTTTIDTTMPAIEAMLQLLNVGGVVAITAYPGHESGKREYHYLIDFLSNLPVKNYTVSCWSMINHASTAPVVYLIEKVRS